MKISIDRLSETPSELHFDVDRARSEELVEGLAGEGVALRGALRIDVQAHRMAEDVYLEGVARADLELTCSRCLARYGHALREPFRIVLEPAGERVPSDPEGAEELARDGLYLGDELEAGWYRGHEIDLTRFLREVVALSLPVQPLCREECRGLCPRCGVDRNTESCSCAEASPDSPFAVLGALRVEQGDH